MGVHVNIALVMPKSTFLIDPMVYPPLGLWYLAARIESLGHHTEFFDLSVDQLPSDGDFDQMWVSATSPQMAEVRRIGGVVALWNKTRTVLGGPAVWSHWERCYGLGYTMIASGEADSEASVKYILDDEMDVERHLNCGVANDLEWVLPPLRRWAHRYRATLKGLPTTTMFTSRGCPMHCVFCESGRNGIIWSKKVRFEPLWSVEQQLNEIADAGFKGVMFYDDIFPINPNRTDAICTMLRDRRLIWRCFLRSDIIHRHGGYDYLRNMAHSGLCEVLVGVESASNIIKENIEKGTTIEQDTQLLEWCRKLNITFKASLILGLPGETMATMNASRDWIFRNRPDRADVNLLIPLPGTPIGDMPEAFDIYWEHEWPEEVFYKGPRDSVPSVVGTQALRPEQIRAFHDQLIKDMERAGIPY